jgi:hypothetical protein
MLICRLSLLSQAQRLVRWLLSRRLGLHCARTSVPNALPTDALTHPLDEPSKFVRLYALVGNLRLFASADVIVKAEEAMHLIFETYNRSNIDFRNLEERQENDTDVLRAFSEACCENLHV